MDRLFGRIACEKGAPYIAMECVDGETLEMAMKRPDRDERWKILMAPEQLEDGA